MSRETRLALARPAVRRGLWTAWLGGGLVYSAVIEAPSPVDAATNISGATVPAVIGWLALAAGVIAYRLGASPRAGMLCALGPLVVSGVAPTPLVVAVGLVLSGLAGGWVVGAVSREAQTTAVGPAGAGLSLVAAAGGLVLAPLSSLWMAGLAGLVLLARSTDRAERVPAAVVTSPDPGVAIEAHGLSVAFGTRKVLDGVSLGLRSGELVALVGGNGSGKSTLLRVMSGHLQPDEGALFLDRAEVVGTAPEALARLGVTLASGSRPVFPDLTVQQNLQVASWVTGEKRHDRLAHTETALARFPELAALSQARAGTLSGGEQRLLALTASLSTRARVLLADEVTLGLSPEARRSALRALRRVADSGAAVLVVEHELRDLLPLADRVLVLEAGRLSETHDASAPGASFIPGADE